MRITDTLVFSLMGVTSASSVTARSGNARKGDYDKGYGDWKPKTKEPHFFQLKIDDNCYAKSTPDSPYYPPPPLTGKSRALAPRQQYSTIDPDYCFEGYAIRLNKGVVIATPYNKWWDPPLATFFVDDDTQLYTVSKQPLQLYIDAVTGALRYTKVGWLPPNSISISFYHTGDNPLGIVNGYSPSLLTWPSTPYITPSYGNWLLCPDGTTGQFTVWVNDENFESQGPVKAGCFYRKLAAVNANPWKKKSGKYYDDGYGSSYEKDSNYKESSSYEDPKYEESSSYEKDYK